MAAGILVPLVVVDMPVVELGLPVPAACTALKSLCGQQFGPRLGNGVSVSGWQPREHLLYDATS